MVLSPLCSFSALLAAALLLTAAPILAGEPAADWQRIKELDAGPKAKATTQAEARTIAMAHLDQQERALRGFLSSHPTDPNVFEARLRISRLLQIRADFEKSEKLRAEAKRFLDEAEKSVTPEQKVELDFARVAFLIRSQRTAGEIDRERVFTSVRAFQAAHPDDRRLAALLAEVATLFDAQPRQKRALLADAMTLAKDEELRSRIADDLKRLDLIGQPVALSFPTVQGKPFDIAAQKGRVIVVTFFAEWSPPAVAAIGRIKKSVEKLPPDRVQVVGVSLDQRPEAALQLLRQEGVNWPTHCDGKGWQSPLVRGLGINTLPTVWLVDTQGRLRSVNALDSLASQARQLLGEGSTR